MQASAKIPYRVSSPAEVKRLFNNRAKYVISFAGFGELGYQDKGMVAQVAEQVFQGKDLTNLSVNAGTLLRADGEDGIAEIYRIAKRFGIETSGIHPSEALRFVDTHYPSEFCDHVYYVEDNTWGGFLNGTREMSPTLRLLLDVTDELVVIGGGKHAADEMEAFIENGKLMRYFPAEMSHEATRSWCAHSGAEIGDFRGDAYRTWLRISR